MSPVARELLAAADSARRQGDWEAAERGYLAARQAPETESATLPRIDHNLALCALSRGDFRRGAEYSLAALRGEPALWLAGLVHAKCLRGLGQHAAARDLLDALKRQLADPAAQPMIDAELADLLMNEFGDPTAARRLLEARPATAGLEAELTAITTGFYDSELDADRLFARIVDFAGSYLGARGRRPARAVSPDSPARHRIGLISPFFSRSPVYFFCIGALRRLAERNSLFFFNRSPQADAATEQFRSLASEWHDCPNDAADRLDQRLRDARLDVLIDLGGWSDVMALQALAARPAPVLLKWVGGQSASTGMTVFDGFVTDAFQSPEGSDRQHSEPLLRLPSGYVSYAAPAYLPRPQAVSNDELRLGVVANPAKISNHFLATLGKVLREAAAARPLCLRFIDRRMALQPVRERIAGQMQGLAARLEFIAPGGHADYLAEVGKLSAVVDTFPYSGGLTAVEALAMGVPILDINPLPVGQRLFCGCHAFAHGKFARQGRNRLPPWIESAALSGGLADLALPGPRFSYLDQSPRVDHQALADSLHSTITDTCTRFG